MPSLIWVLWSPVLTVPLHCVGLRCPLSLSNDCTAREAGATTKANSWNSMTGVLCWFLCSSFFKKILFLDREGGREKRGRETSMWGCLSHALHWGDLAYNPGMCHDWESNLRPFISQARSQSTEPHQPGMFIFS